MAYLFFIYLCGLFIYYLFIGLFIYYLFVWVFLFIYFSDVYNARASLRLCLVTPHKPESREAEMHFCRCSW